MNKNKKTAQKYIIISSVFMFIFAIYIARLVFLQFDFKKTEELRAESDYTTETVVIQALRGNICDRNGKVLVTTSYSYDILFDYNDMSDDFLEFNRTILAVVEAMNETQNNQFRVSDLFPFAGEYPNLTYSTAATTEGTSTYNALRKMLSDLHMENATAEELVNYFVKRWKYNKTDANGDPYFTNEEISALIRVRYDMLRTQFGPKNPYCIASGVGIEFLTYIKELNITGVSDKISTKRTYIYPGYASHILGRVGAITAETWEYYKALGYDINASVGLDGCEKEFEEYLRGRDGVKTITRNAAGEIVKEEITLEPIAGKDVWLTIDIDAQIAAEDTLAEYMSYYNKNEGASVAIDPNTGDVLAIASYPTYDLTSFSKDYNTLVSNEHLPLLNRATGATYAPGSTFKVAVALAGLEKGAIGQYSTINCNYGYTKHGLNIKCENHNTYHTHNLNVVEALTWSCNAFFIETGYDYLDNEIMTEYCKALGLGQATGIEINELLGQIACPENSSNWTLYEEASSYIGQSIHEYTPLQVTSYISTVSNGGTRYATHLLHSVRTFSGEIVLEYEKQILSSVDISASTLSTIKLGMKSMVENSGTANYNMYTRYGIDVTVCGKSGTAQIGGGKQNCWFTAFAPMENPKIVVTSLVEEGSSGASVSWIDAAVISAYLNKSN
jgi:penicillin-binding protein 2